MLKVPVDLFDFFIWFFLESRNKSSDEDENAEKVIDALSIAYNFI